MRTWRKRNSGGRVRWATWAGFQQRTHVAGARAEVKDSGAGPGVMERGWRWGMFQACPGEVKDSGAGPRVVERGRRQGVFRPVQCKCPHLCCPTWQPPAACGRWVLPRAHTSVWVVWLRTKYSLFFHVHLNNHRCLAAPLLDSTVPLLGARLVRGATRRAGRQSDLI